MAFTVFDNSQQGALFVLCVVTIPICAGITILRFFSTGRAHQKIALDDIFALFALLFHLLFTTLFLYLLAQLNGQTYTEIASVSPAKLSHILMVGWIASAQYCGNQLFAKLSLLVLYRRIFSVNRTFNIWVYVLGALQIAWFISTYIVKYLLCVPVKSIWDLSVPGKCINIGAFLAATESVNSLIDFALIGLACWIVHFLQIQNATKWKLGLLFAIGGLSGVIGFIKIREAYSAAYNNFLSPIWDIVQMATSIICCSAPIYKSLVPDFTTFRKLIDTFNFTGQSRSHLAAKANAANGSDQMINYSAHGTEDGAWLHMDERI
ncbi:hypothetical protein F4777DRAFT_262127 [Nemania sp. FL0916]|nr:hypothetical protein F4777DRAFT_262127 [Nemania sp. FL0916]